MLNLGPKNTNLAHGMQNALFGRAAGKDGGGNNVVPPAEQNLPHPPPGGAVVPPGTGVMNHHGPKPVLPPGFPANIPGRKRAKIVLENKF